MKLKLPSNMRDSHHLLFTFYHVTCKAQVCHTLLKGRKKVLTQVRDGDPLSTPVGYTWVPLLEKGSLATGRHELPVTSELPPSGGDF